MTVSNLHAYNGTRPIAIRADESTRAINTIGLVHHKTHAGNFFMSMRSDTLATGDTIAIAITTPNTDEEQHLEWNIYGSGAVALDLIRNVSSYTGGTAQTPMNHNDRSTNSSNCTVKVGSDGALVDPIVITGGTIMPMITIGSGNKSAGESGGGRQEHILAKNEITIFRLTAVGNSIKCDLTLHFYEHTPRAA